LERVERDTAATGMTRNIIVRPEAKAEVQAAFDWYEEQSEGLGFEFLRTIDACLAGVTRNPLAYTVVHPQTSDALWCDGSHTLFFIWLTTKQL
jgi:hypothetical protein